MNIFQAQRMRRKKRGVDKLREEHERFNREMSGIANPSGKKNQSPEESSSESSIDDEKGAVWDSLESIPANRVEGWECFPHPGAGGGNGNGHGGTITRKSGEAVRISATTFVTTSRDHVEANVTPRTAVTTSRDVTPRTVAKETTPKDITPRTNLTTDDAGVKVQLPPGEVVVASSSVDIHVGGDGGVSARPQLKSVCYAAPQTGSKGTSLEKTQGSSSASRSTETSASRRLRSKVKDILERLDAGACLEGCFFGGALKTSEPTGLPEAEAYLRNVVNALSGPESGRTAAHWKEQDARDSMTLEKLLTRYSASNEPRNARDEGTDPIKPATEEDKLDAAVQAASDTEQGTERRPDTERPLPEKRLPDETEKRLPDETEKRLPGNNEKRLPGYDEASIVEDRKVDSSTGMDQQFADKETKTDVLEEQWCNEAVQTEFRSDSKPDESVPPRSVHCPECSVIHHEGIHITVARSPPRSKKEKEVLITRRSRNNDDFLEKCRAKVGQILEGRRMLEAASKTSIKQPTAEQGEDSAGVIKEQVLRKGKENKVLPVDGNTVLPLVPTTAATTTPNKNKRPAASPAEPNTWQKLEVKLAVVKSSSRIVTGGDFDYDQLHKELADFGRERVLIEQRDKFHRYSSIPDKAVEDFPMEIVPDAKARSKGAPRIKRARTTRSPPREQEPGSKLLRSSLGKIKPLLTSAADRDARSVMPQNTISAEMKPPKKKTRSVKPPAKRPKESEVLPTVPKKVPAWVKRMTEYRPKLDSFFEQLEKERGEKSGFLGTLKRRNIRPPDSIFKAGKPINWLPEHGAEAAAARPSGNPFAKGKTKWNVEDLPPGTTKGGSMKDGNMRNQNVYVYSTTTEGARRESSVQTIGGTTASGAKAVKAVQISEPAETSSRRATTLVDTQKAFVGDPSELGKKPGWVFVGDFAISELDPTPYVGTPQPASVDRRPTEFERMRNFLQHSGDIRRNTELELERARSFLQPQRLQQRHLSEIAEGDEQQRDERGQRQQQREERLKQKSEEELFKQSLMEAYISNLVQDDNRVDQPIVTEVSDTETEHRQLKRPDEMGDAGTSTPGVSFGSRTDTPSSLSQPRSRPERQYANAEAQTPQSEDTVLELSIVQKQMQQAPKVSGGTQTDTSGAAPKQRPTIVIPRDQLPGAATTPRQFPGVISPQLQLPGAVTPQGQLPGVVAQPGISPQRQRPSVAASQRQLVDSGTQPMGLPSPERRPVDVAAPHRQPMDFATPQRHSVGVATPQSQLSGSATPQLPLDIDLRITTEVQTEAPPSPTKRPGKAAPSAAHEIETQTIAYSSSTSSPPTPSTPYSSLEHQALLDAALAPISLDRPRGDRDADLDFLLAQGDRLGHGEDRSSVLRADVLEALGQAPPTRKDVEPSTHIQGNMFRSPRLRVEPSAEARTPPSTGRRHRDDAGGKRGPESEPDSEASTSTYDSRLEWLPHPSGVSWRDPVKSEALSPGGRQIENEALRPAGRQPEADLRLVPTRESPRQVSPRLRTEFTAELIDQRSPRSGDAEPDVMLQRSPRQDRRANVLEEKSPRMRVQSSAEIIQTYDRAGRSTGLLRAEQLQAGFTSDMFQGEENQPSPRLRVEYTAEILRAGEQREQGSPRSRSPLKADQLQPGERRPEAVREPEFTHDRALAQGDRPLRLEERPSVLRSADSEDFLQASPRRDVSPRLGGRALHGDELQPSTWKPPPRLQPIDSDAEAELVQAYGQRSPGTSPRSLHIDELQPGAWKESKKGLKPDSELVQALARRSSTAGSSALRVDEMQPSAWAEAKKMPKLDSKAELKQAFGRPSPRSAGTAMHIGEENIHFKQGRPSTPELQQALGQRDVVSPRSALHAEQMQPSQWIPPGSPISERDAELMRAFGLRQALSPRSAPQVEEAQVPQDQTSKLQSDAELLQALRDPRRASTALRLAELQPSGESAPSSSAQLTSDAELLQALRQREAGQRTGIGIEQLQPSAWQQTGERSQIRSEGELLQVSGERVVSPRSLIGVDQVQPSERHKVEGDPELVQAFGKRELRSSRATMGADQVQPSAGTQFVQREDAGVSQAWLEREPISPRTASAADQMQPSAWTDRTNLRSDAELLQAFGDRLSSPRSAAGAEQMQPSAWQQSVDRAKLEDDTDLLQALMQRGPISPRSTTAVEQVEPSSRAQTGGRSILRSDADLLQALTQREASSPRAGAGIDQLQPSAWTHTVGRTPIESDADLLQALVQRDPISPRAAAGVDQVQPSAWTQAVRKTTIRTDSELLLVQREPSSPRTTVGVEEVQPSRATTIRSDADLVQMIQREPGSPRAIGAEQAVGRTTLRSDADLVQTLIQREPGSPRAMGAEQAVGRTTVRSDAEWQTLIQREPGSPRTMGAEQAVGRTTIRSDAELWQTLVQREPISPRTAVEQAQPPETAERSNLRSDAELLQVSGQRETSARSATGAEHFQPSARKSVKITKLETEGEFLQSFGQRPDSPSSTRAVDQSAAMKQTVTRQTDAELLQTLGQREMSPGRDIMGADQMHPSRDERPASETEMLTGARESRPAQRPGIEEVEQSAVRQHARPIIETAAELGLQARRTTNATTATRFEQVEPSGSGFKQTVVEQLEETAEECCTPCLPVFPRISPRTSPRTSPRSGPRSGRVVPSEPSAERQEPAQVEQPKAAAAAAVGELRGQQTEAQRAFFGGPRVQEVEPKAEEQGVQRTLFGGPRVQQQEVQKPAVQPSVPESSKAGWRFFQPLPGVEKPEVQPVVPEVQQPEASPSPKEEWRFHRPAPKYAGDGDDESSKVQQLDSSGLKGPHYEESGLRGAQHEQPYDLESLKRQQLEPSSPSEATRQPRTYKGEPTKGPESELQHATRAPLRLRPADGDPKDWEGKRSVSEPGGPPRLLRLEELHADPREQGTSGAEEESDQTSPGVGPSTRRSPKTKAAHSEQQRVEGEEDSDEIPFTTRRAQKAKPARAEQQRRHEDVREESDQVPSPSTRRPPTVRPEKQRRQEEMESDHSPPGTSRTSPKGKADHSPRATSPRSPKGKADLSPPATSRRSPKEKADVSPPSTSPKSRKAKAARSEKQHWKEEEDYDRTPPATSPRSPKSRLQEEEDSDRAALAHGRSSPSGRERPRSAKTGGEHWEKEEFDESSPSSRGSPKSKAVHLEQQRWQEDIQEEADETSRRRPPKIKTTRLEEQRWQEEEDLDEKPPTPSPSRGSPKAKAARLEQHRRQEDIEDDFDEAGPSSRAKAARSELQRWHEEEELDRGPRDPGPSTRSRPPKAKTARSEQHWQEEEESDLTPGPSHRGRPPKPRAQQHWEEDREEGEYRPAPAFPKLSPRLDHATLTKRIREHARMFEEPDAQKRRPKKSPSRRDEDEDEMVPRKRQHPSILTDLGGHSPEELEATRLYGSHSDLRVHLERAPKGRYHPLLFGRQVLPSKQLRLIAELERRAAATLRGKPLGPRDLNIRHSTTVSLQGADTLGEDVGTYTRVVHETYSSTTSSNQTSSSSSEEYRFEVSMHRETFRREDSEGPEHSEGAYRPVREGAT